MSTNKGPGRNKCLDCKGTGVYQGIGKPVDCPTCKGMGWFAGVNIDLDLDPVKEMGDDEMWPAGVSEKQWRALSDLYKKHGAGIRGGSVTDIKAAPKAGMSPACPAEGDVIHVYDAGWYEAVVELVYDDARCQGGKLVKADHTCGTFRIPINDICWNVTEGRWEHIRHGTPVW